MLNEGIVPTAMLVANDQMALGAMRAITESAARWCGYLGSGIRRYRRQLMLYPAVNHHQTGFSPAGANQRDRLLQPLRAAVKGNQLLPVSLVKEKPPRAQYANRLSPRVGRFINAAGNDRFPDWKAGSERNAINVS